MPRSNLVAVFSLMFLLGLLGFSTISSASERIVLAQVPSGNATTSEELTGTNLFSEPTSGTSFQYPDSWDARYLDASLLPPGAIFAARLIPPGQNGSNNYVDNVIVGVYNSNDTTLEQYTMESLNSLRNSTTISVVNSSSTMVADNPAHRIEYTETFQGLPVMKTQIWTVADNRIYLITYGADESEYSKYLPNVETIVGSLQINRESQIDQQSLGEGPAANSFFQTPNTENGLVHPFPWMINLR